MSKSTIIYFSRTYENYTVGHIDTEFLGNADKPLICFPTSDIDLDLLKV